jgi:hypothetical protein
VSETIQFYDGIFPELKAGTYEAQLDHTVTGGPPGAPSWSVQQAFTVQGPQFAIDPGAVVSVYPPDGSVGDYDLVLAFVVLDDPTLPWERSLVPGDDQPGVDDPTPWIALVVVQDSDLVPPPGTTNPVVSGPVGTLLQTTDDVLAPAVDPSDPTVVAQAITIAGERFAAVMPTSDDIVHLAHCRRLSTGAETGLNAVVIANRLPQSAVGDTAYHAHLVSLEGLKAAIAPGATLPQKTGTGESGPKDVVVVSLASWTFTSTAEGAPFSGLVAGLITTQAPSPGLSVPIPANASPPDAVAKRLTGSYVPLEYGLPSGEATFAWYRGPLTPEVPQQLPVQPGGSSDALLVYSQAEGIFDVSYAAAWQLGRALGLADPTFAQSLVTYRQFARSAAALLGQRSTVAHLAGVPAADLVAPNPTRRRLVAAIAEGLGERWTAALREPDGERRPAAPPRRPAPERGRAVVAAALDEDGAAEALADQLADLQVPVASWLAGLALLEPLPFANLVPDPSMLPVESVRFFYVDPAWQQALAAGAMSIGVTGSADVALDAKLQPSLDAAVAANLRKLGATGASLGGMLIRSALVPAWPTLVIAPSQAGKPLPTIRRETLGADVLICIWSGVPDLVTLAEPYQGLRFGIDLSGVALRDVTTPGSIGKDLGVNVPVTPVGGRVDVAGLAAAIGTKLGISALGAGDLAIQLVLAPESQTFPSGAGP